MPDRELEELERDRELEELEESDELEELDELELELELELLRDRRGLRPHFPFLPRPRRSPAPLSVEDEDEEEEDEEEDDDVPVELVDESSSQCFKRITKPDSVCELSDPSSAKVLNLRLGIFGFNGIIKFSLFFYLVNYETKDGSN